MSQINEHIKDDSDITSENIKKITYLDCLQKETTRHHGPLNVLVDRIATKDHQLKDVPIWKGTNVLIFSVPVHYSEQHYEHPHIFNPERWESG